MPKKISTVFLILAASALWAFVAGCGSPESRLQKARDLAAAGRHAEAVEIFQKVIAHQKGEAWLSSAWLDLARSQKELGSHPQAKTSAGTALDTARTDPDAL